jgi:hypothetical protein
MNHLSHPDHPQTAPRQASKQAFVRAIREGLNAAGIRTRTRSSTIHFGSNPVMGVRVNSFQPELGLWRVTCGTLLPGSNSALVNPCEFTLHHDEFGPETGANVARLLTEHGWVWPIFAHDPSYPTYAWSVIAARTLKAEQDRRGKILVEAILGRCAE